MYCSPLKFFIWLTEEVVIVVISRAGAAGQRNYGLITLNVAEAVYDGVFFHTAFRLVVYGVSVYWPFSFLFTFVNI